MQSLYEAFLEAIMEDTTLEARMEVYIGLRRLRWTHTRAAAATGIRDQYGPEQIMLEAHEKPCSSNFTDYAVGPDREFNRRQDRCCAASP